MLLGRKNFNALNSSALGVNKIGKILSDIYETRGCLSLN